MAVATTQWHILVVASLSVFLATVDGSAFNIVLASIRQALRTRLELAEWTVIAYWLTMTGLLLAAGRLADLVGRRRLFGFGCALFILGDIVAALSTRIDTLIAARVVQATAVACLLATAPALVTTAFAPHKRGRALGLITSVGGVALAAGPTIAQVLLTRYLWPTIFWAHAGACLLTFIIAMPLLPPDQPVLRRLSFDFQGSALLIGALSLLLLAVHRVSRQSSLTFETVALAGIGGLFFVWFLRVESESRHPVLDLTLFRNGRFAGAAVAGLLAFIMLFHAVFLLPIYLTQVKSLPANQVGYYGLILPLTLAIFSPISGSLSDRFGTRGLSVIGLAILGGSLLAMAELTPRAEPLSIAASFVFTGIGAALFLTPNYSALMGSAPPHHLGTASGLLSVIRNLGMVLGTASALTIFSARFQLEAGHSLDTFEASDTAAFQIALRLSLHLAAALTAPAILASLMKNKGQTLEPPTLF